MRGVTYCRCRTKKEAERIAASERAIRFADAADRVPVVVRHVGREWQYGPEKVLWYVKLMRRTPTESQTEG